MNSCIVIRGNNFGLPPLVMQQGWIVCHHTTQHQHAGASVLTPLLCFSSLGICFAGCRSLCPTVSSQVNPVWDISREVVALVSKATVPSAWLPRSHRKLPVSLINSCCRSTLPPEELSFAGLYSRNEQAGGHGWPVL